jgi:hypothetical protein
VLVQPYGRSAQSGRKAGEVTDGALRPSELEPVAEGGELCPQHVDPGQRLVPDARGGAAQQVTAPQERQPRMAVHCVHRRGDPVVRRAE